MTRSASQVPGSTNHRCRGGLDGRRDARGVRFAEGLIAAASIARHDRSLIATERHRALPTRSWSEHATARSVRRACKRLTAPWALAARAQLLRRAHRRVRGESHDTSAQYRLDIVSRHLSPNYLILSSSNRY